MKINHLVKTFAWVAAAFAFAACNDAEYEPMGGEDGKTVVYFSDASAARGTVLIMRDVATNKNVTVRLNAPTNHDVKVKIGVDATLLDEYNERFGTDYVTLSSEYYTFNQETVIPAGDVVSAPIVLTVNPFVAENGATYALPLIIKECTGAQIAERPSQYVYELLKEIGEQPAASFQGWYAGTGLGENPGDNTEWGIDLDAFTLEWWINQSAFSVNNQAIFTSGAGPSRGTNTELYVRFGDTNHNNAGANRYAYLQIKCQGSDANFETADPAEDPLQTNTWYHFAITYTAGDGKYTLYQNGVKINESTGTAGQMFYFDRFWICKLSDADHGYRPTTNYTRMCQVRMWKTARTEQQIQNYMYVEPRYNDPNLIFFLPMNEGNGAEKFIDVTGHGYDGVIGNMEASTYPRFPMQWSTINLTSEK